MKQVVPCDDRACSSFQTMEMTFLESSMLCVVDTTSDMSRRFTERMDWVIMDKVKIITSMAKLPFWERSCSCCLLLDAFIHVSKNLR